MTHFKLCDFQLQASLTNGERMVFGVNSIEEAQEMLETLAKTEPRRFKEEGDIFGQTKKARRSILRDFLHLYKIHGSWRVSDKRSLTKLSPAKIKSYYSMSKAISLKSGR